MVPYGYAYIGHNIPHTQNFCGVNLANRDLFAILFLANTHRYTIGINYVLHAAYSRSYSSPTASTCMVCQNFSSQNFPVYDIVEQVHVLIEN